MKINFDVDIDMADRDIFNLDPVDWLIKKEKMHLKSITQVYILLNLEYSSTIDSKKQKRWDILK